MRLAGSGSCRCCHLRRHCIYFSKHTEQLYVARLLLTVRQHPHTFPHTQEIGGTNCLVLQQDAALGTISTIVLRGSTEGFLDDVERAVNDAINTYKALCRDARMLPGGGAPEIEVARQVGNGRAGRRLVVQGKRVERGVLEAAGRRALEPDSSKRAGGRRADGRHQGCPQQYTTVHYAVFIECCLLACILTDLTCALYAACPPLPGGRFRQEADGPGAVRHHQVRRGVRGGAAHAGGEQRPERDERGVGAVLGARGGAGAWAAMQECGGALCPSQHFVTHGGVS